MSYSADGLSGGYYNNEELVALQQLTTTQRSIIAVQADKIRAMQETIETYRKIAAQAEATVMLLQKSNQIFERRLEESQEELIKVLSSKNSK